MGKWKSTYNDGRQYHKEWEKHFKWLLWKNNSCMCKWCNCVLTNMRKSAFEKHEKTTKHQSSVVCFTQSNKIPTVFNASRNECKELKEFEIKFSVSTACHCSIRSVDHQMELVSRYSKGSVLERVKLHKTKCMSLIKNVVAVALLEDLVDDLKNTKYSLLIDESIMLA